VLGRGKFCPFALGIAALEVQRARTIGVIGWVGVVCGCVSGGGFAPETYVVRPQDTLYGIAWRHDLDYHDLARWNHIGPEYRIAVGQTLVLRPPVRVIGRPPTHPAAPTPAKPADIRPLAERSAQTSPAPSADAAWVWPTDHASSPRPVPGGGILLIGQLGQAVRAASRGRVVYVGSGLRGYGNLIIIKHGDSLLSAYAHTRELSVREGQEVLAGQSIAQMGAGPHQIPALYFEIRLNGKPVDPLPYLAGAK
jgi:lipoprotein NlpD